MSQQILSLQTTKKPISDIAKAQADLEYTYLQHPDFFIEHKLGIKLWSGMRMAIDAVWNNKRVSIRACHAISKTKVAAAIAVTYLNLYEDAIVVTTAPGNRQIEKLLWKEIREIYMRIGKELRGTCLQVEVKCNPESYMIGFATDNATRIEGWHSAHILFILDEAKGIPQWCYDALDGSMSGKAKMLEISTTDGADQLAPFRQHHTSRRSEWKCINMSAWDSPFVSPATVRKEYKKYLNKKLFAFGKFKNKAEWPIALIEKIQIADDTWIDGREEAWKIDRPELWSCKVIGEFWEQGVDNIIPLAWLLSAVEAEVDKNEFPLTFGADVARMGDDRSVLTEMQNTMETSGIIAIEMKERGILPHASLLRGIIKIDADGVGSGVFDRLAELGYACYGLMSGSSAYDRDTFYNYRMEMWWHARAIFERQYKEGNVISIPDDPELIEELSGMKYKIHSDSRRKAELKEEYKKRLGRSPDKGDSFVYCLARVDIVEGVDDYQEAKEEEGVLL